MPKSAMTNVDVAYVVRELNEIVGTYVENIYDIDNLVILKLHSASTGTISVLIEPGVRIHKTEYKRETPRIPTPFAMTLRKHLRGKKITAITQHNFDRLVSIKIGNPPEEYTLVIEIIGSGNLILLDPNNLIFVGKSYKRMKDRAILPKKPYEFPEPRGIDPNNITELDLKNAFESSQKNLLKTLIRTVNLDPTSCDEILLMAKVNGKQSSAEVTEEQIHTIYNAIKQFVKKINENQEESIIVYDDENPIFFAPFPYLKYKDKPTKTFDTFSKAIDEYFVHFEEIPTEQITDDEKERQRLRRIIEKQLEGVEKLRQVSEEKRKKAELIYGYMTAIDEIINTIKNARTKGIQWNEIIEKFSKAKEQGIYPATLIEKIEHKSAKVILNIEDMKIDIDFRKSAVDNANEYFEGAKKARAKIEGALRKIKETTGAIAEIRGDKLEIISMPKRKKIRKKKWYEKFHWFYTSEGYLVIAGRDAKTNEQIVKKHLEINDILVHADIHGAPHTVIKVPKEPPSEQSIYEAAIFATSFSRGWKEGWASADAYWVHADQVSTETPSGEYLARGAFTIKGKKNILKGIPLELAVGITFDDEFAIPISGPIDAIKKQTDIYLVITPGDTKKGKVSKSILKYFIEKVDEQKRPLVENLSTDEINSILPSGDTRIIFPKKS